MTEMHYIKAENKRILASNSVEYVYRELGEKNGVPIIALNHLSANLDNWDPVIIDGLAKDHWIITFDYQGVGGSTGNVPDTIQGMAEDTVNFINALGFSRVNILGFSMGGMVAQELMEQKPALVEKAILAGTGPRGGQGISDIIKISDFELLRAIANFKDVKTYLFFTRTSNGKNSASAFISRLKIRKDNRDKTINWFAYRKQLHAIKRWGEDSKADLSKIKQPILVVNGDHDIMVPTTPNTYDLHERLTNSELIIYKDSGHGSIAQNNVAFVKSANLFY
ncbi:alpha/beta fold hydrolase [Companilactobacillus nantensis]|uniref:Alpha beta hydrolase n=1 Tax=Companilactobacillus nantensis DSM 16982 TaxID=1423774 RepID=A0A0R1WH96_9LACO|nr:alpha/beta hydrolase [Companilactobacillus nantensis]KRM17135.1 alpha beta hydrolase [Companilactobacillus nantensis DSM 16982]GEO64072.1 alpha/beta hydrolase [Companilactobacillus nantensis]